MKHELKVYAGDSGDMSVGIWPSQIEITFKCNFDMGEVMNDINHADNRRLFREDLEKFIQTWFTEMPAYVYLEDECQDCGAIKDTKKKHKCPLLEIERKAL
jgi:hypothetical protein